ncbi:hypothetical protein [Wolbachia endosymbiont of Dirofilaria (Dirofilaria) immitis]|uniref:hypothetical protein n=1 Tax=Wolbachia endosymbiont of Dirofilaria (Dirofilaria) immitis TaxID=1812115 RepID=UPI00158EDAEC|nr:hypothetical protein [Wolbachia endosymbiont of Dirofilaria (Dirofilaria) immitis]QKX02149.1 hypothetical protein GOY12_00965 [Wolbachia endosymbiont of Dirofilaria (Dirofilaria) immitis]
MRKNKNKEAVKLLLDIKITRLLLESETSVNKVEIRDNREEILFYISDCSSIINELGRWSILKNNFLI